MGPKLFLAKYAATGSQITGESPRRWSYFPCELFISAQTGRASHKRLYSELVDRTLLGRVSDLKGRV